MHGIVPVSRSKSNSPAKKEETAATKATDGLLEPDASATSTDRGAAWHSGGASGAVLRHPFSPDSPVLDSLTQNRSTRPHNSITSDDSFANFGMDDDEEKVLQTVPDQDGARIAPSTLPRHSILSAQSAATDHSAGSGNGMIFAHPKVILRDLKAYWSQFTLFGISNDESPRVWGNRIKAEARQGRFGGKKRCHNKALAKMVDRHAYGDEMKLQLRDQSIPLSYLDIFDHDGAIDRKWIVRVFSIGATLLEYWKIFSGIWTFFISLLVIAFWDVLKLESDGIPTFLVMDLAFDFLFMLCLAIQLRTSTLDVQTGKEYCSIGSIWSKNIFSRTFWLDTCSCVPFIFVRVITNSSKLTRCTALIKSVRGWRIFRTPPEHRFVPSTSFQLFQLSGFIMMGGHLIACLWFLLVHDWQNTMSHHAPASNAYKACLEDGKDGCWWNLYTVSINQGVYLLLGIESEAYSAWEHFFVTICAPVGALVHAYMLGRIILLIQRGGALETKKNEHTMAIQEAMRILALPPNLQMRIVTFFTYERIHRSGRLFRSLFSDLSPQLRFELQLHLYLDLVGKSRLFMKTKPRVIREIVTSLEDLIFLPGDWVCRLGDYGDSMYFIVCGDCSVIGKDTVTELKVLARQDYFGEVALLTGVARTASVRANTFCIMAHLTKEAFAPIVYKWPEELDVLLHGVEKESDKAKFKAQAAKLYGLARRNSSSSVGPESSGTETKRKRSWGSPSRRGSTDRSVTKECVVGQMGLVAQMEQGGNASVSLEDNLREFLSKTIQGPPQGNEASDRGINIMPKPDFKSKLQNGASTSKRMQNVALLRIQSQLTQALQLVSHLQAEVRDQKDILANSLTDMKLWAAEATKDAVAHEMQNRRGSSQSAVSGYSRHSLPHAGISTPFT